MIHIEDLKKSYKSLVAINKVSLDIHRGEMFGLVGPDGAGKTTLIRAVCGLLQPEEGTITVDGVSISVNKKDVQKKIGYLSQRFSLYGDLSIDENIEFFAEINGVTDYKNRRDELLAFTRLTPFRNRLADRLSGGMKQKLALACSLIHKPGVLLLDEPTVGVDPVSRRDFWKILSDLRNDGITILYSTPYLDEAERCSRIALMHKGSIIALDTPEAVQNSIGYKSIELVCENVRLAGDLLKTHNMSPQLFGDRLNLLSDNPESDAKKAQAILGASGLSVQNIRVTTPSLENVFIHLVSESRN